MKKHSKYFSLVLILFLINSNFCFAIEFMVCGMGMENDNCECENIKCNTDEQIINKDSDCCKIILKEINNSNLSENPKKTSSVTIIFHYFIYFSKIISPPDKIYIPVNYRFQTNPPPDIPVLYSHILI